MNFDEELSVKVGRVNQALLKTLPEKTVKPSRLHEAIRHSLEAGGKRDCVRIAALQLTNYFQIIGIRCRPLWHLNVFMATV